MKVGELRSKLEAMGEPTNGIKGDLVDRLTAALAAAAPAPAPAPAPAAPAVAPPSIGEQHAFLEAAKQFDFDKVKSLVLANPAYVNVQPCGRWTAIHQAAYNGNQVH